MPTTSLVNNDFNDYLTTMTTSPVNNDFNDYLTTRTSTSPVNNISIEGLDHVVRQWNNKFSKVGHLVFSLGQWCTIVAYQIP